jgi:spore photoproduct lyase
MARKSAKVKPKVKGPLKSYGSIISKFDKTPVPKKPGDIYCPHFWEFKPYNGCAYDCAWCYLNGTFRFRKDKETGEHLGKQPYLKNLRETRKQLTRALKEIPGPVLFNAGEVSDALVFEKELMRELLPIFQSDITNPHGHKILLLTKSSSIRILSHADPGYVVIAHSINAEQVSKGWEHKAPTTGQRLHASRQATGSGFETRLRIDPMVPVDHWEQGYKELVDLILRATPHVSVITLGSLRGLQSTINECKKLGKDVRWTEYLKDTTNWGRRVPEAMRVKMYTFIIELLKEGDFRGHIALCKETLEVWKAVGLKPEEAKCNCML